MLSYNDSLTVLSCALVTCSMWVLKICKAYSVLPVMHFVGGGIRGNWGSLHRCMRKWNRSIVFFFLCTVCYKNGNETGSDLVLIVGGLLYLQIFRTALFNGSTRRKIFPSQSHRSPSFWVTQCYVLSCWLILHWKCSNKYINISEFSTTCFLSLSSPLYSIICLFNLTTPFLSCTSQVCHYWTWDPTTRNSIARGL